MNIINELQDPSLIAQCPNCHGDFQLSKTILFDGTKQFPPQAEDKKLELKEELNGLNQEIKDRLEALKKFKISVAQDLDKLCKTFYPLTRTLIVKFLWQIVGL